MPKLTEIVNGQNKRIGKMYLEYPRIQSKGVIKIWGRILLLRI